MMTPALNTAPRMNRTICMYFCQAQYYIIIQYAIQFRIQNERDTILKKNED